MLLFIDESGHDRGFAPYEVLAGIAVKERDLWNLIQAIRNAEIQYFGVKLASVGVEFKGKKLLKNKTFRHSRQSAPIEPGSRRQLAQMFLLKGWREVQTKIAEERSREEFSAYGQAAVSFVMRVLELCDIHHVKIFAGIVHKDAPRPNDPLMLRRDYAFLFQRFYYYLENYSPTEMGIVVFDELEKAKSRILVNQMERYYMETEKGYRRSSRIVPEPFFVHSDLTTAVQLADIVAYCLNWGMRLNKMTEPVREEIKPYADYVFNMRYVGKRLDEIDSKEWPVYGIFYLDDLRPKKEREPDEK